MKKYNEVHAAWNREMVFPLALGAAISIACSKYCLARATPYFSLTNLARRSARLATWLLFRALASPSLYSNGCPLSDVPRGERVNSMAEGSGMLSKALVELDKTFGHSSFKSNVQETAVLAIVNGKLVVPTMRSSMSVPTV